MPNEIIKNMTNLADSGQDEFVENWSELAKITLYEKGISKKFINSNEADYVIAKVVTDLVEDGNLSNFTMELIKTLRVNHSHIEDEA